MVKSGIEEFPALAIAWEGSFYSHDDVTVIVDAVGRDISVERRKVLREDLELAAERWALDNAMQRAPTALALSKRLEEIEKAATKLLSKLGTGPGGAVSNSMPPSLLDRFQFAVNTKAKRLGVSSISLIRDSVSGVVNIRRWSKRIVQEEKDRHEEKKEQLKKAGTSRHSRTANKALKNWIITLAGIYKEAGLGEPRVSQPVGYSYQDDNYSGPFFRFIKFAASDCIQINKTNNGLGKFIQRSLDER